MLNQTYYRLENSYTNTVVDNCYLLANCTGLCVMNSTFKNSMPYGRKDYYVQYVVVGELEVYSGEEIRIMKPGDLIVYYPDTEYCYGIGDNTELVYYWVHFSGLAADAVVEKSDIKNNQIVNFGVDEELIKIFKKLFKEFIVRDSNFENSCAASILEILVMINRKLNKSLRSNNEDSKIYRALEYIHQNYSTKITIDHLAELENFSKSRFISLFKQCTGMTPIQYITALRINQACAMLLQSDMSINKIAKCVGYDDPLYFSRVFYKNINITPSDYRRME